MQQHLGKIFILVEPKNQKANILVSEDEAFFDQYISKLRILDQTIAVDSSYSIPVTANWLSWDY